MSGLDFEEDGFIVAGQVWQVKYSSRGDYCLKDAFGETITTSADDLLNLQARLATRDEIKSFFTDKIAWLEQNHAKKIARIKATIETLE
jgi:hypothetical protein